MRDQEFRRQFGLKADKAFVESLQSDDSTNDSFAKFGVRLTEAEAAEYEARLEVLDALPTVHSYGADHRDEFAGVWVDQKAGGIIRVAFTSDHVRHLDSLRARFPFPSRLSGSQAAHSLAALDQSHARVAADLVALRAEGIGVLDINTNVVANVVEIGVDANSFSRAAELRSRYGDAVRVITVDGPERSDRYSDYPPVKGGTNLTNFESRCSSAFGAYYNVPINPLSLTSQSTRAYRMLTAGHCFEIGESVFHDLYLLGDVDVRVYRPNGTSRSDAESLTLRPAEVSDLVYKEQDEDGRIYYEDIDRREVQATVGTPVCMAGVTSGLFCGQVTTTNYTAFYSEDNATLTNQIRASFPSQGGDSGGAMFYNRTAMGIMSGLVRRNGVPFEAIYTHIENARLDMRFELFND